MKPGLIATLGVVGVVLGCGGTIASSRIPSAADGPPPTQVSEIAVSRLMSTWETGPHYRLVLYRDRPAEYTGMRNVPRLGYYSAPIPAATFDSLAAYLVKQAILMEADSTGSYQRLTAPPAATRWDACSDMRGARISVVNAGTRHTITDSCADSTFAALFITPVERATEKVSWRRSVPR